MCAASSDMWMEKFLSNIPSEKHVNEIREELEHHISDPSEEETHRLHARDWLDWANNRNHVKVTEFEVPQGILPNKYTGVLYDVRVHARGRPDDDIYDNNADIRQKVARGNCFIKLYGEEENHLECLVYALKKFTGGLGDDDDRGSGDDKTWRKYFISPISEVKSVVCTRKANGEAAHLSARKIFGEVYLCVGSKNVHLLIKTIKDIEKYQDQRFAYAKEISYAVMNHLKSLTLERKTILLHFLCSTKLTAVMEMLSPHHQHVEDFSHMKETQIVFITWATTKLQCQSSSQCCMPPHVAIDIADTLGFPTVSYEVIKMEAMEVRVKSLRAGYGYEGEVLYCLDTNNSVVGLIKKKTIWYILCRATREKLRAACMAQQKNPHTFSLSAYLRKLEARYDDIQQWLVLSQETVDFWKALGVNSMKWCIERLQCGELDLTDITDKFPVTWKSYLQNTNQDDQFSPKFTR